MITDATISAIEPSLERPNWPTGDDEMAARIRACDWAATPLGPIASWPQSLKTAVAMALDSAFPTYVWWGSKLIQFHNDATVAIHRAKHPAALGRPAAAVWSEVWEDIGPLIAGVLETGTPFMAEDLVLLLDRGGPCEEACFTFCYSALRDDAGAIAGVQGVAIETTGKAPAAAALERAQSARRESEARLAADLAGMRRLYDLHARLANETDLHVALGEIVAAANEFLGTERGCIQLVSADGERLEMFAYRGYDEGDRFIQHFLHEGSKPACDAARRDRRRLVIEDVAAFPALQGTVDREVALADGIRATQSTPMLGRSGELVGVLSNQFSHPHLPSDEELRLIDLLAWTAADFVERHHASAARRESEERQAFLLALSDALRPLDNADDMQKTASRLVGEWLNADRAYFAAIEPNQAHIVIPPGHFMKPGVPDIAGRYPMASFAGAVIDTLRANREIVIADTQEDARLSERERAAHAAIDVRAYAAVPLVRAGRLVAAFGALMSSPRVWAAEDIAIIRESAERTWAAVERGEAEAALRESEARYRTLFTSLNVAFCTIRVLFDTAQKPVDYVFLDANPAFAVQTGLVDAVGKRVRELRTAHEEHWFEVFGRIAFTGHPERFENQVAALGRWYSVDAFRIGPPENHEVGVLLEDITSRKRAEAERQNFVDAAAHDLRTPLTSLKGRAQLLRNRARRGRLADGDALASGLEAMETDANRMAALIDEMLDAAHVQSGRLLELNRFPTDLAALAQTVAEETRLSTTRHEVRIVAEASGLVGDWDEVRLRRVLANLLGNAVKYSPDGGEIVVRVGRDEDAAGVWAVIAVSDRGVGIPASDLLHLFERFYRGRNTSRIRGTGIGLAGARQIVEQHGGAITVASVEGQGSTFTVRLPLHVG